MAKYRVFVRRTEIYLSSMIVHADSRKDAMTKADERLVDMDADDWGEVVDAICETVQAEVINEN